MSALAEICSLAVGALGDSAPTRPYGQSDADRAVDLVRRLVEQQKATTAKLLDIWGLLDDLDPNPEQPVTEGSVEAVDFVALAERIAARLALVRP